MRRRFDECLCILIWDWDDSVLRRDIIRSKSVYNVTFIIEGGYVVRDYAGLTVDNSEVYDLWADLCQNIQLIRPFLPVYVKIVFFLSKTS